MLHGEHARGERLGCVVRTDRHGPLRDDRTAVILLVHVVDGRSGERDAARQHGLVDAAAIHPGATERGEQRRIDRKSTRLNSSHLGISYAVFCLKKKKKKKENKSKKKKPQK